MNANPVTTDWSNNMLLLQEPRRIALIGTSPSSAAAGPFEDKRWEIWGVSARGTYVTRANRWFELHRLDGEPADWAKSWRVELKKFAVDIPEVVMMFPEPWLAKNVTQYPVQRITARFGTYFMTSTFAWMMALAIDEMRPPDPNGHPRAFYNGDEISIFGVDMEYDTEYRQQRAGFRHMIDLAKALGVTVTRDVAGGLVHEPTPYPFWQDDPQIGKIERRNGEMKKNIDRLTDALENTAILLAQNRAVMLELDEIKKPDYDEPARRAVLAQEIAALEKTAYMDDRRLIACRAVDAEQKWHLDYLRP